MGVRTRSRTRTSSPDIYGVEVSPSSTDDFEPLTPQELLDEEIERLAAQLDERRRLELEPIERELAAVQERIAAVEDERVRQADLFNASGGGPHWFKEGWEERFREAGLDPDAYRRLLSDANTLGGEAQSISHRLKQTRRPLDELERSIEAKHRERARLDLVGQVVKLTPEQQDCSNPLNPFALDPTFPYPRQRRVPEQQKWSYATVHPSGTVIKAKTRRQLDELTRQMDRVAPLMEDFAIGFPVLYGLGGETRGGVCQSMTVRTMFGASWSLPHTISLNTESGDGLYSLIHEMVHLDRSTTVEGVNRQHYSSGFDYQSARHGEDFRRKFGSYLDYYLRTTASDEERLRLLQEAERDTYAPPIFDEHLGEEGWVGIPFRDDTGAGRSRVVYSKQETSSLGEGWSELTIPIEDLF